MWVKASRGSPHSDQGHHRHRGLMNPSCFPEQFSVWQPGLDFSLRHSQADWVPLIPWEIRRVMPRETRVFADCACTSLCCTMSKADLFSQQCSATLAVTLEKNFTATQGQLQHSQQWQVHCRLCAPLASVPAGLSEGGWHLISSYAAPCHASFYALGKTESAAEAAFSLPGGLAVPSVEIITFQAVGVMQAACQN